MDATSGKSSISQRLSSTSLAIAEESENHEENEHDDDDTESKESFKEKVINTNYEKVDNGLKGLRRKSLAPIKHE